MNKPFNFDKWFNISLIVILGFTVLSLVSTFMAFGIANDLMGGILGGVFPNNPDASSTLAEMPGFNILNSPTMLIGVFILHIVTALIFIVIAYFVLKQVEKHDS